MHETRFDRLTQLLGAGLTRRAGFGLLTTVALAHVSIDDTTEAKKIKCKGQKTKCGGKCVVVKTDRNNCGACNRKCTSGQVCAAGVCQPGVSIVNFAFQPATLTVPAGSTVVWTNNGRAVHTVTADDLAFDSDILAPGERFSHTFATPGEFPYHCTVHPSMTATITVTA